MKNFFAVITVLFMVWSTPSLANSYMNGEQLTDICLSFDTDTQSVCESYIAGVIDYHNLVKTIDSSSLMEFCVPNGTKLSRLREAVSSYLSINKQHKDFVAAPAVALALYEIYPCNEGKAKKKRSYISKRAPRR